MNVTRNNKWSIRIYNWVAKLMLVVFTKYHSFSHLSISQWCVCVYIFFPSLNYIARINPGGFLLIFSYRHSNHLLNILLNGNVCLYALCSMLVKTLLKSVSIYICKIGSQWQINLRHSPNNPCLLINLTFLQNSMITRSISTLCLFLIRISNKPL